MLEKTMKQIINKKINKWLETIDDESVRKTIQEDLIITGGCFTSMIQNETPKDYDCYLRTKESAYIVAKYYVDKWNEDHGKQKNGVGYKSKVFVLDGANPDPELLKYYRIESLKESESHMISNTPKDRIKIIFPSDGIVGDPEEVRASEELGTAEESIDILDETDAEEIIEKEKKPYHPVFLSTNAITLSDGIQIVVRFYGEPSDIHDTFDFEHAKAYYDISKNELSIPKEVYELVINKTLRYTGSKYPVCSLFRMRKFIDRGWRINAGQILKISMQVSELDLMDIDVLEEQLIGVDSLYFMQLINQFRRQKENDSNFELTTNYVISIIDKIF
jgi:hypothetical protein